MDTFWKDIQIMQYDVVALNRPLMPSQVTKPGYVASVPPIPDDEKEAFHTEYLDLTKISFRTNPITAAEARKCQFDRLDFVQKIRISL